MSTNHVTTPINTGLVSAEVWQQVQTTILTMLQQGQLPPIPAPIFTSDPVPSLASLIPPDTANLSEVSSADSNASNQDHSDPKGPPSASPQQLISFRPDNNEMDHIEGNSPDDANQDEDNFHPLNRNCEPQADESTEDYDFNQDSDIEIKEIESQSRDKANTQDDDDNFSFVEDYFEPPTWKAGDAPGTLLNYKCKWCRVPY
ncbi:hypothetical protein MJO29_016818 [Puccinia striiformis f. sp. tritici]|nr:hypothetical protein MJO29_016818 [Puccinia striiformis f. sp. tritici]